MSNARVVQRVYEAFGRGDVPAVLARLDSAVEWHLAEGHPYSPTGRTWVGHSAIVENFFARAGADWDRFAIAVVDLHEAGDAVVAEVRYSGTFAATGRELDAQGCHVWKFRDGKVTAFQQYVDTSQLQAVTGTVPPRGRS
jgi:ketosteroid isomerase-like protein